MELFGVLNDIGGTKQPAAGCVRLLEDTINQCWRERAGESWLACFCNITSRDAFVLSEWYFDKGMALLRKILTVCKGGRTHDSEVLVCVNDLILWLMRGASWGALRYYLCFGSMPPKALSVACKHAYQ